MPDVLLFGATGYTGRLTAAALGRRGLPFAVAGRNRDKLERLADATGAAQIHVVAVGDTEALSGALEGAKVLITCVGPFSTLGATAVEAALAAKVHYIDSTGEGPFIDRLIERDSDAREAGIAMAPSMGFDEVPSDVAATLAAEDMKAADLTLTYAAARRVSGGTIKSVLPLVTAPGPWLVDGQTEMVRVGHEKRWAPFPPPLGPKLAVSMPLAETRFAPRHLDLRSFRTFVTAGAVERAGMRYGVPLLRALLAVPGFASGISKLVPSGSGPDERARAGSRWTILAEARTGPTWRNVVVTGTDMYGLTGETLAAGAARMIEADFDAVGVLSPVQTLGVERWHKELIALGVDIEIHEPMKENG